MRELSQQTNQSEIIRKYNKWVARDYEERQDKMKSLLVFQFQKSALNQCKTQPLRVVLKDDKKSINLIKTGKVFFIPIYMVNQVKSDLDTNIRLGILEK